jgi:hypothetical protein
MIHYHGGPITPRAAAISAWTRRHAMISFANPDQLEIAAEVCQSFALDNGAYPLFTAGKGDIDVPAYAAWVNQWCQHPGFDWCLIPDKIDGTEDQNDELIQDWCEHIETAKFESVPVYHMHESLNRLDSLVITWRRVAIGSSGEYWEVGSDKWWGKMHEIMEVACYGGGIPKCKLHGLRMLDPTIFSQLPLSSADSTNVARNIGLDVRWSGPYVPKSKEARAMVLIDRIEHHASASTWSGVAGTHMNGRLFG